VSISLQIATNGTNYKWRGSLPVICGEITRSKRGVLMKFSITVYSKKLEEILYSLEGNQI
jgi:hypothetical protein